MANGLIGINVRTLNVNRDNTLADLRQLAPAFTLVMDDPQLAAAVTSVGSRVIYRQLGDQILSPNPAQFVQERAKNAPAGALIHTTNELKLDAALCAKEIEYMRAAEAIGRRCCIINASTHQSREDWQKMEPAIQRAVANGHAIGLHVYFDGRLDEWAFEWGWLRQKYGGVWIVTEFGYIADINDPYTGWRHNQSAAQYAQWLTRAANRLTVAGGKLANMPLLIFSYEPWPVNHPTRPYPESAQHGTGIAGESEIINALAATNATLRWKEGTVTPPTFKDGVVDRVLDGHANVRQSPSTTAKIIGQLVPGNRVRYNSVQINAGAAGAYRANGLTMYTWWQLEGGGYVAVGVLSFADPNQIPDVPIKWLNVPHISQLGTGAQKRNNDCGLAASKSVHDYAMQKAGLMPMKLTVDRLIEDTPLATSDDPLGLASLVNLLAVYGVKAHTATNMTPAALRSAIDAERPVIALVNYRPIGGESFGHYVVVIGYGSRGFWIHDPYKRGANVYITTEAMEAALTEMTGIAGAPYQGVILG